MLTGSKQHLQESQIDIDFQKGSVDISDPIFISPTHKLFNFMMTTWMLVCIPFVMFVIIATFCFYGITHINADRFGFAEIAIICYFIIIFNFITFIFVEFFSKMYADVMTYFYRRFRYIKEGPLGSKEIRLFFSNKFVKYEMEGDYADYRSAIEIHPIIEETRGGRKKIRFWSCVFRFSQEPKNGNISIVYN
jgi:hypothetical protein